MDLNNKKEIGFRVREQRELAGYTREQLGELCGLSPRFIANVEFGDSCFSLDSLISICKILSCNADYLLFGGNGDNSHKNAIISKINNIDDKYISQLEKVIQGFIEAIEKK